MKWRGAFSNGEEALAFFESRPADVVITDIKMPKMDGMELCARIRSQNRKCKIVILSGYGEFSYAQQAIKYGVCHYLLKPIDIKIRDMLQTGELGTLKRINWIATDWYRPQSYHNSCAWRSSWAGEGGGVIINQCPHNLDLWQWMFGMPESLCAFADFGKYYDIEVEDDVTVYMRYPNGVTGVFIASTGEAPGTNRLEIIGTLGKLTYEKGKLIYMRNREDERSFNRHFTSSIAAEPEKWVSEVAVSGTPMEHKKITQNFVNAILNGEELIAPGENGINEMNISNAIHYSAWTDQKVTLPVDNAAFLALLREKINHSSRTAKVREGSGQTQCI